MTAQEIVDELKPLGQESYKKVLLTHGVKEPLFGVKVEYLKKLQKDRVNKDYPMSCGPLFPRAQKILSLLLRHP